MYGPLAILISDSQSKLAELQGMKFAWGQFGFLGLTNNITERGSQSVLAPPILVSI